MTENLTYDYRPDTIDPAKAKRLLADLADPLAARHNPDDACPYLEPVRVILDREGRVLKGTDMLAHIIGTGAAMDAIVYEDTRPAPAENAETTIERDDDYSRFASITSSTRLVPVLKERYPGLKNAVNFAGYAVLLTRLNDVGEANLSQETPFDAPAIIRTLDAIDAPRESLLYGYAKKAGDRTRRSGGRFRSVTAAILMRLEANATDEETMRGFWQPITDGTTQPDTPQRWLVDRLGEWKDAKIDGESFQRLVTGAWNAWREGGKPEYRPDKPMPLTR